MKTTKRLICLFAAILSIATMLAEVVYEPLIVSEGFNKDCIAETKAAINTTDSPIKKGKSSSCFATKSVIREVNTGNSKIKTDEDLAITIESGWPDDYRETIRCILDAKDDPLYKDVIFQLAAYDRNNVLTMRPDCTCIGGTGTLKFKKVGCYNKMFFLTASLKDGTPSGARKVSAIVYYTDGSTTKDTFNLADGFGGLEGHKVCMTNIYEGYFDKNTSNYAVGKGKGCASVFDIDLDETKLVDRVDFKNEVDRSAAIIFAVTGRTADIAAPADESTEVHNVGADKFEACWEAIQDAASYRLDVATDPDFQNILADYNNKVIAGETTCQEIVDLVSNNDYYWRVRSVNSDGGQSASSAPRRVVLTSATPPATNEESEDIESMLAEYAGYRAVVPTIQIHRTLYRDGYFNTLCLPFNMTTEEIAASPLAGMQVYEFVQAEKMGDGSLDIEINGPIDAINAGVPYLVRWAPTDPEIIDGKDLIFHNVNIVTSTGRTIGGENEVQFIGNIGIADMVEMDVNNLFLGANNTLYWPEGQNRLKGFRAYFQVPASGGNAAPRHTPARLVERHHTPTGVENIEKKAPCSKILKNGTLYILRDGRYYNLLGGRIN